MERVRDRLGTELSWTAERFEAHARRRTERIVLAVAAGSMSVSIALVTLGVFVDARLFTLGGLFCLSAYGAGNFWALLGASRDARPSADRLVAERGRVELDGRRVDAREVGIAIARPAERRGPTRVGVFVAETLRFEVRLGEDDASRVASALASALGATPREATTSERLAWRTPRGVVLALAAATVLLLVLLGALNVAIVIVGIRDVALGRTLAMIAGPIVLLSPIPYWALARRTACAIARGGRA